MGAGAADNATRLHTWDAACIREGAPPGKGNQRMVWFLAVTLVLQVAVRERAAKVLKLLLGDSAAAAAPAAPAPAGTRPAAQPQPKQQAADLLGGLDMLGGPAPSAGGAGYGGQQQYQYGQQQQQQYGQQQAPQQYGQQQQAAAGVALQGQQRLASGDMFNGLAMPGGEEQVPQVGSRAQVGWVGVRSFVWCLGLQAPVMCTGLGLVLILVLVLVLVLVLGRTWQALHGCRAQNGLVVGWAATEWGALGCIALGCGAHCTTLAASWGR